MKKNLFFGFLILFVLSTTAFAGFSDPKKESEKPAVSNTSENKLTNEELNHLTRRAEIDNLASTNIVNKENADARNNLKTNKQVIVENRHHGGYFLYGGGTLLLIIILVIVLV